jgi:hypothetical protein
MNFVLARHTREGRWGKNKKQARVKRHMDRKNEILTKLEQIQEQAQLTLDELPLRLAKDRLRLIIGLARYLSTTIDLHWDDVAAQASAAAAGDALPPPAAPRA